MTQTAEPRTVADLKTDTMVPREQVHKSAIDQVFVTDWMQGPGETLATVAAQLPLAHARFSDTAAPYHDIVLVAETVRQAGLILASEIMGVPPGRQFILRELRVELDPLEHNVRGRDSQNMLMTTDPVSRIKMRPNRTLVGGLMKVNCEIAGRPSGSCEVVGAWLPDEVYESMRGDKSEETPEPAEHPERELLTGKLNPRNSVLTPVAENDGEYTAAMVVLRDDPTFFDHVLDHVPGLLMLEAIQQLTVAAACRALEREPDSVVATSFNMKFSRLAEFAPDAVCAARFDAGASAAEVRIDQLDKTCCSGSVGVALL
jgi:hypothetical protein